MSLPPTKSGCPISINKAPRQPRMFFLFFCLFQSLFVLNVYLSATMWGSENLAMTSLTFSRDRIYYPVSASCHLIRCNSICTHLSPFPFLKVQPGHWVRTVRTTFQSLNSGLFSQVPNNILTSCPAPYIIIRNGYADSSWFSHKNVYSDICRYVMDCIYIYMYM